MAIEIVDLPIKNGGSFHSYVSLPEGICYASILQAVVPHLAPQIHGIGIATKGLHRVQPSGAYSYGHLPVISGDFLWDYTFYKWGFVSTYNW